jgi:hypothetical protein
MKYELTDLTNAWEMLGHFGKQEITFTMIREDENKLNNILGLIKSMPNFNGKLNHIVANRLNYLINELPKRYYNEGNRNNGSYLFDHITLKGDDTIILRAVGIVNDDLKETLNKVERLVYIVGKDMNADEHTVKTEYYGYNMHETTIRLWWD